MHPAQALNPVARTTPSPQAGLVLVTDTPVSSACLAFLRRRGGRVVHVSNLARLPDAALRASEIVVVDVDLKDPHNIVALRATLAYSEAHHIFAIEPLSHQAAIQANALGADRFIDRPLEIEQLQACLQDASVEPAAEATASALVAEPGGPAQAASAALAMAFEKLRSGQVLDAATMKDAAEDVISSMAETDYHSWLNQVRDHHSGTFQHCLLVTGTATAFGRALGLCTADLNELTMAGLLHDVGKAQIPLSLLDKPGRLTEAEFEVMKAHPSFGHKFLLRQPGLSPELLFAVKHHHEALDGSGYPDGLSGKQITDLTRLLTICDVYGAMIEQRAYKQPATPAAAIAILRDMASKGRLETALVEAFAARMPA